MAKSKRKPASVKRPQVPAPPPTTVLGIKSDTLAGSNPSIDPSSGCELASFLAGSSSAMHGFLFPGVCWDLVLLVDHKKDLSVSLGHNTSSCATNSSHKQKQHTQTTPTPSGCSNPSVDTEAVEKQPLREEPQGEAGFDPMSTEAAVVGEDRANTSNRKRAKLTIPTDPIDDHIAGSPIVVPVSENDTTADLPPRRQYLTRSKDVATSN
ncbi:hypothetical protein D5086_017399 [Populus alba]|uniref:Uncharacterized protein n=2 Tax=Populus alba TaxID=43335 RepID=A0A4U5Q8L9_POPAL|nr:hypothetical protein D5086_0000120920 [Populus alba]